MRRKFLKILSVIFTVMLLGVVFLGCSEQEEPPEAMPAEPAHAGAIADGILQAFNDGDYAAYSEHFDEAMQKALNEAVFEGTRDFIREKIGDYVSREVTGVKTEDIYTTVTYKAKFSEEPDDVTVNIVFLETGDYVYVSGLWFDSPKLRE